MFFFSMLFFAMAVAVYLWPVISIYYFLRRADEKTPGFAVVNLKILHYLKRYRKSTKIRQGQTGPLYFFWFFTLGISLMLVALGILCLAIS